MAARQLMLDRLEARRMGQLPKPSTEAICGSLETGSVEIRCIAWPHWFVAVCHEWSWQGWLGCWRGR
jgi:hypothetical protein